MTERENDVKSLWEERAQHGPSSRRRAVRLVELVGSLVLAIALSSMGLGAAWASAPGLERSNEASAARWERLGESYEAARAEAAAAAMTSRFMALAAYYGMDTATLTAGLDADTVRWVRLGEAYEAARAEAAATAMTSRFTALAAYYGMEPATLAAGFDADTLRWFRLGEAYAAKRAEAAAVASTERYKALADYCSGQPVTTRVLLCSASYEQFKP